MHHRWCSAPTLTDLGTLGGTSSSGININDNGQVVGSAYTMGNTASHAFLYSSGTMFDLNGLVTAGLGGSTLSVATDINDSGQIVATACGGPYGNFCQAYRLDPIARPVAFIAIPTLSPEALGATALLLLTSGLLVRWRRKQ